MAKKEGKEFIFPNNVESGYNLIKGVTVKAFFSMFIPFFIFGLIIMVIPPYINIYVILGKVFIGLIIWTVGLAITAARPVKERQNITMMQHIGFLRSYSNRQKLFYRDKIKRR